MKHDIIIAIDPDCDKSGLTELHCSTKSVAVCSLNFPELVHSIILRQKVAENENKSFVVLVEAGWINSGNWHTKNGQNHKYAAAIGNKTGRNHETGRKIIEMLKFNNVPVEEVKPLKKCWRGPEGKITQSEISYFIPGFPKRSNQEERDSVLLAWYHAGLPIKVKPLK